jgi:hypothetical protein
LLRIELRRNAMGWMLPVAVALFWYQAYRHVMALPPMWNLRAMTMQNDALLDFAMPVAGASAWMGWRDRRRHMAELLSGTPRSRWARQAATWAATTGWALAGYLGCVAVVYVLTARQASGGGPLWWPVVVGAVGIPALSAFGFTAGALIPSRFTAPLVTLVAFFGLGFSSSAAHDSHSVWLISPLIAGAGDIGADPGVATFYHYLPDLSIVQAMFLAGLTLTLLGILGLPSGSGGGRLRAAAATLAVAGLAAAGTAGSLVETAHLDRHGMIIIPAVHDAASDQPVRYTPVCAGGPVPVCMNPVYAAYLPDVTKALDPMLSQVAGLPGVPARLSQTAQVYVQEAGNGISLPASNVPSSFVLPGLPDVRGITRADFTAQLKGSVALPIATAVLGITPSGPVSPAQQALMSVLTRISTQEVRRNVQPSS